MAADVADASGAVKALVVRAEDARLLGDMEAMRKFYRQLRDVNRCVVGLGGSWDAGRSSRACAMVVHACMQ